jgi:hypothetical protein
MTLFRYESFDSVVSNLVWNVILFVRGRMIVHTLFKSSVNQSHSKCLLADSLVTVI